MERTDSGKEAGPTAAAEPRPAAPAAAPPIRISPPLVPVHQYPALKLETRQDLAAKQAEIAGRIAADPALSVMLLINPVLAFGEFGVEVSADVSRHIMHSLHYLPGVQDQYEALKKSLGETLGEEPRPNDPAWLARTLFDKLKLQPLDTGGQTPAYRTPMDAAAMEKLQSLRPKPKPRYPGKRLIPVKSSISVAPPRAAARGLDLDAALPALKPAAAAPSAVTLTDLYFYKDSSPVARQLLQYGMVLQLGVAFHTPATFREVRDGSKPNAFRAWIKAVRFTGTKP